MPCALLQQAAGVALKGQLAYSVPTVATLSWADIVPRAASVVDWQLWSNSNDECGVRCDRQKQLLVDLAPAMEALLTSRQMTFQPHYITQQCREYAYLDFCQKQCLNAGRYCAQDPDGNLDAGFSGRDVVLANLHSLCAFQAFDAARTPWLWWRYVTRVGRACSMRGGTYSTACADGIAVRSLVKHIPLLLSRANACAIHIATCRPSWVHLPTTLPPAWAALTPTRPTRCWTWSTHVHIGALWGL